MSPPPRRCPRRRDDDRMMAGAPLPGGIAGAARERSYHDMERLLTLIAGLVASFVLVLLPGTVAYSGHESLSSILRTEGEINGRLVTQLINANPELWKTETLRLEALLQRRPTDRTPEARGVYDLE